jgi:hypothetical protein
MLKEMTVIMARMTEWRRPADRVPSPIFPATRPPKSDSMIDAQKRIVIVDVENTC